MIQGCLIIYSRRVSLASMPSLFYPLVQLFFYSTLPCGVELRKCLANNFFESFDRDATWGSSQLWPSTRVKDAKNLVRLSLVLIKSMEGRDWWRDPGSQWHVREPGGARHHDPTQDQDPLPLQVIGWSFLYFFNSEIFGFLFLLFVLYSTLLHLPPLRFHCVGGCWDRTHGMVRFRHWLG